MRSQSKFFPAYSVSVAIVFFLEYQIGIVGVVHLTRTVTFWENLVLVCLLVVSLGMYVWARKRAARDRVRGTFGSPTKGWSCYCKSMNDRTTQYHHTWFY